MLSRSRAHATSLPPPPPSPSDRGPRARGAGGAQVYRGALRVRGILCYAAIDEVLLLDGDAIGVNDAEFHASNVFLGGARYCPSRRSALRVRVAPAAPAYVARADVHV